MQLCLTPALKRLRTRYCPNITLGFSFRKPCLPNTSMCNFPQCSPYHAIGEETSSRNRAGKGYKNRNGPKGRIETAVHEATCKMVSGTLRSITEPLSRGCAHALRAGLRGRGMKSDLFTQPHYRTERPSRQKRSAFNDVHPLRARTA
ncbi:uncharacterized protein SPAR_G02760 [Saccharomyces paradoxus]|uniref:Uncharacterized protein n=1 Tax=Saccharomyces paradoxus TaxID=27291 RepID=A0A8B8URN1_SACPA|nr:uncharacterized protein SPAR_G02760 [Saccharomyces paradoxus]QHS73366.1 hypothetical protein SPAR_G02760 [Saccharomyces paradoxus]